MIVTRRAVMKAGGGAFLAALLPGSAYSAGGAPIEVVMKGRDDGAHVWFDPFGVHIAPGQTVRWTNRDAANSHTTTSYHPSIADRPLRIPPHAKPWDSDYLLPGESFSVTFVEEGVYDYYCVPHEHAGMVGRIVVGTPPPAMPADTDPSLTPLPEAALNGFPSVEEIIAKGAAHRE